MSTSMWVRVCGAKLGPIHVQHFPKLMEMQRLTADVRSGEEHCYIADPKHLAEVVDLVAATARADAYRAGLEAAAKCAEGGRFLHTDAPVALWAKECAAAIRALAKEA